MITVDVYKKKNDYQGFHCLGHAGFDISGRDIVCAAVSVLVINTVNSIDALTEDKITVSTSEEKGEISLSFQSVPGAGAALLMDSMMLGLFEIEKNYGGKYLKLSVKEV